MSECNTKLCLLQEKVGGSKEQEMKYYALGDDLHENASLPQNNSFEHDSLLSLEKKKRKKKKSLQSSMSNKDADNELKFQEGWCGAWDNNTMGDNLQQNNLVLQTHVKNDFVPSYGKKKRKHKSLHSSISNNDTDNGHQERRDTTLDNSALGADHRENSLLLKKSTLESDWGLSSRKKKRWKQKSPHSSVSNIRADHGLQDKRDSALDADHDLQEGRFGGWDDNAMGEDLQEDSILLQTHVENDLVLGYGMKKRRKQKSVHSSVSNNDTDNGHEEGRDTTLDNNASGAGLGENALLLQNATLESDLGLSSGKKKRRMHKSLQSSISNIKTDHDLQVGRDSALDKNGMGAPLEENALSLQNTPTENESFLSSGKKNRNKWRRHRIKKDNLSEMLCHSPERPLLECSRKKLLILDLNGLLVDVVPSVSNGYLPDIWVNKKAVFKRPFCDKFLQFCFEKFDVGVWTSRIKKNMNILLSYLFRNSIHRLLFCWDRTYCSGTPFNTLENKRKPLVLKELKKLWEYQGAPLSWKEGNYNESNTVLLDDSPVKALRNPLHTGIFPEPYNYKNNEDNSLGPRGDIRCYLEGLAMAENVQKYIEQNPFGQQAIMETDPRWDFYSKILVCKIHRC